VDGGQSTGASTTPADSLTTLTANDLLIGVGAYDGGTTTFVAGASYTLIGKEASNANQDHLAEFRLVTTATSYTVDSTIGTSISWGMRTAGFKEAAAGITVGELMAARQAGQLMPYPTKKEVVGY